MAPRKNKFTIKLQPINGPVHLQGLAMWGGSSNLPNCPRCEENDEVIAKDSGEEFYCKRCRKDFKEGDNPTTIGFF